MPSVAHCFDNDSVAVQVAVVLSICADPGDEVLAPAMFRRRFPTLAPQVAVVAFDIITAAHQFPVPSDGRVMLGALVVAALVAVTPNPMTPDHVSAVTLHLADPVQLIVTEVTAPGTFLVVNIHAPDVLLCVNCWV
jgi:hypothetical protein